MSHTAEREKQAAAQSSVVAAVFLTILKIIAGVLSGSLGILSEAAHSGLDLVAALITYFAVRVSDEPPDRAHLYGHGKIENLSALAETLILLVTCVWIIYEAVQRLFYKDVHVEASIWTFLVMIISIAVDISRSRMLNEVADRHNSQALKADALHFSTDIWSSGVVLLGLGALKLAELNPQLSFLTQADAVAALGVALIVVGVSIQMGRRTIDALLDTAPSGLALQIREAVETLPRVVDCHRVRVRPSGPHLFIDAHVVMDGEMSLRKAHDLTEQIEEVIGELLPNADITVHPEPAPEAKVADPNPP